MLVVHISVYHTNMFVGYTCIPLHTILFYPIIMVDFMHLFVREIHVQQLSTIAIFCAEKTCGYSFTIAQQYLGMYPLVNVYITMEHHHFLMGKLTISMAIIWLSSRCLSNFVVIAWCQMLHYKWLILLGNR